MKKFWNFIRDADEGRVLRLEGPIDEETFWGDEITPQMFRDDLDAEDGDVTVWINSPGGNVFAAAEIYTMLCDYKGKVTVKIDAVAASAASVIAMAGDRVCISPVGMLMIHDPITIAMGNTKDMEQAIATLNEVKESIINAYQRKSGLSRNRISKLMSDETWLNSKKALDLGFVDEILFDEEKKPSQQPDEDTPEEDDDPTEDSPDEDSEPEEEKDTQKAAKALADACSFSTRKMRQAILNRICRDLPEEVDPPVTSVTATPSVVSDSISEPSLVEPEETVVSSPPPEPKIVIGMDGKTEDGSMPYEILKDKLEWLK